MKKTLIAVLFCMAALMMKAQTFTVGLVDMNEVLTSMPEINDVKNRIRDAQTKYFNELKLISDEFQRQYEQYEATDKSEEPIIRERRARLLQDTQQKKEAFETKVMQELEELQGNLMKPLYEKVQTAIGEIGKENRYNIIMDNGSDSKIYFYGQYVEDITPLVKQKLGISSSETTVE